MTGNSLGLQPKGVASFISDEINAWKEFGVDGHFEGKRPWFYYHHFFSDTISQIVGAQKEEVVVMNNLTVNLHLLLASFYRPNKERFKIIMEGGAFPSDMYVIESQIRHHGLEPEKALIEVTPRAGEYALRDEDILQTIEEHKDELALVFFSGVQYFTGQVFDIKSITRAAHEAGAIAGFDLAHAAGNVKLELHEWNVDFAAWCSYKYLNSGPGSVSGIFVNEKHGNNPDTPRFAGWWGYNEKDRFLMKKGFVPEPGAAGWQLSNAPVFNMVAHLASLKIFDEVGMEQLNQKSKKLNAYLEFAFKYAAEKNPALQFEIITPEERGCKISVFTGNTGKRICDDHTAHGVITDWKEHNVSGLAPVPLHNSITELYRLSQLVYTS